MSDHVNLVAQTGIQCRERLQLALLGLLGLELNVTCTIIIVVDDKYVCDSDNEIEIRCNSCYIHLPHINPFRDSNAILA